MTLILSRIRLSHRETQYVKGTDTETIHRLLAAGYVVTGHVGQES